MNLLRKKSKLDKVLFDDGDRTMLDKVLFDDGVRTECHLHFSHLKFVETFTIHSPCSFRIKINKFFSYSSMESDAIQSVAEQTLVLEQSMEDDEAMSAHAAAEHAEYQQLYDAFVRTTEEHFSKHCCLEYHFSIDWLKARSTSNLMGSQNGAATNHEGLLNLAFSHDSAGHRDVAMAFSMVPQPPCADVADKGEDQDQERADVADKCALSSECRRTLQTAIEYLDSRVFGCDTCNRWIPASDFEAHTVDCEAYEADVAAARAARLRSRSLSVYDASESDSESESNSHDTQ